MSTADTFSDDGVTSYSQLLFDIARKQVVVGARYVYRLLIFYIIFNKSSPRYSIYTYVLYPMQFVCVFIYIMHNNVHFVLVYIIIIYGKVWIWRRISTLSNIAMRCRITTRERDRGRTFENIFPPIAAYYNIVQCSYDIIIIRYIYNR